MSGKEPLLDQRILDIINEYLTRNRNPDTPVTHFLSPEELLAEIQLDLPDEGCTWDDLLKEIETYLKYSVRTGHPQFFNQLWSGITVPGLLGDIFTSLANTSMYTYEVAPVATLVEKALIRKMGALAGFQDPEGLFLTGGSNGNLQAMMIARNRTLPDVRSAGLGPENRLTAFVSQEAHYSFEKAANILGIGVDNVIKVETDDRGGMMPEDLERKIARSLADDRVPFFLGATAGTTVKGAFDPCERLFPIARRHRMWFHVDGSLGGTALLSPSHRRLLQGLEEADSFVWNAHKLMGLPLICSVFLLKERGHLARTNSVSGTDYIFHDEHYGEFDLGPISLQCGRKVDAFKLWLSWKYYGDKGYAERVERFFDLAAYAEEKVNAHPRLKLMAPRTSVNICFQYVPEAPGDRNAFNLKLRKELARLGLSFVNFARLGEDVSIRLIIAHHELTKDDIDRFFQNLLIVAGKLEV